MNKLWYKKPAKFWREALPLGNGLTGIMVYGGKKKETIAFNDTTLWSGYPKDQTNPQSLQNLDKVRQLIFQGKNAEADALAESALIGHYSESFLPLGNLHITFKHSNFGKYKRELDISKAIHTVISGAVKREAFVSYPDKVAVYRIESLAALSFTISAKSQLKSSVEVDLTNKNTLALCGNAPDYVAPSYLWSEKNPVHYQEGKGMGFCLLVSVKTDGNVSKNADSLIVTDAKTTTLYITTATGFVAYDKMPITDKKVPYEKCKKTLNAIKYNYNDIKSNHIKDYSAIYAKHSFSLKSDTETDTGTLLKQAKHGKLKAGLVELFYNYGKYMTIASSRPGGSAANLQGIWNGAMRPPWSSNYTVNINTEMNYWGASNCNLSECLQPFVKLVAEITEAGKHTAKVNYNCEGSCCNHNVDLWRKTAPVQGSASYMFAPMCGVWLANEVYEHYNSGKLAQFKDDVYKIVKESAAFASSYLVEHEGSLVVCPSASPELEFIKNGKKCSLDYASAFEMSLVRQVFSNYLQIAPNGELAATINAQMPKLFPYKLGETGLLEWHKYYEVSEKGHRHFSPLYGFYPAKVIKYYDNPEQVEWVRKLFEYRINNSRSYIGWSAAWAICLSGRLHDAENAAKIINSMLAHSVFVNLFGIHPPHLFQIDGNFGFVAGINEVLLYEENGIIDLLPALPADWVTGEVHGFVARGASVTFKWNKNKIVFVESDKPIKLRNINIDNNAILKNATLI